MKEIIGKVELNLDYYSGTDLYSDGDVEDTLLDYFKNPNCSKDAFIEQNRSWPILYHVSPIRANIIESIGISDKTKVLEIGAGCGAITERLCDLAESVTCIELSKRRSEINAWRNQNKNNLKIIVGNFETIEPKIEDKYDLITMIGVFEYAASYISTENPYGTFLNTAMKHLKDDGKLVIAIENRLGLKYFAGCKEDHVGLFFEGIEGYPNTSKIKTFSKKELSEIIENCGYHNYRFRYPYPDYKFPIDIFSDEYLPSKGQLNMNLLTMDQSRQILFDESKAFDSLLDAGLFSEFSNSFLVEINK